MSNEGFRLKVANWINSTFVPREIYFRSESRFHYIQFSPAVQKVCAVIGLVVAGWFIYSSGSYVVHSYIVATKNAEIDRHKLAYFDLLTEVSEYQDQFSKITRNLEDNQAYLLSLLERGQATGTNLGAIQEQLKDSGTARDRVVVARDGLRSRLDQFENDLQEIADRSVTFQTQVSQIKEMLRSSEVERAQVAEARERLGHRLREVESDLAAMTGNKQELEQVVAGLREELAGSEEIRVSQVLVQSALNQVIADLEDSMAEAGEEKITLNSQIASLEGALSQATDRGSDMENQRDTLQTRVVSLEQRLVNVGDAQKDVIERISEHTKLSIDVIEKTIKMTKIDVEKLLSTVAGNNLGQGGPFIPLDGGSGIGSGFQIEASMSLLDSQLDRWAALQQVISTIPLAAPMDSYRISSSFGERRDPVNGRGATHQGLDMAAPLRTKVYSTAPGKVVFAGWRGHYGRIVEIDHGHGLRTRYAHLRKILVKKGQKVDYREKVGLNGSSGRSTGPHVHYEVLFNRKPLNPMNFLKAGKYVFKG